VGFVKIGSVAVSVSLMKIGSVTLALYRMDWMNFYP
jgi:hypothetical protein